MLITPSVAEEKLQIALLPTASDDSEWGKTVLRFTFAEPEPANNTFYPFFLHNIWAGLIPPFSRFFYAVLHHYGHHVLHLHPNSVLLLSIFAFYCEAFVGVMPSITMLLHFFYLCLTGH